MKMEIFKSNKIGRNFFILFLFFLATTQQAYAVENPEFIKMKEWKMEKIAAGKMVLTCKAVFYNPNQAKAKLKGINLSVALGQTSAGKITQITKKVKVKKSSAFEIPLRIEIDPETNAWGYISGILSALTLQDFVVNVKGYLKVTVLGIPIKIPVQESEQLNLKDILIGG